MSEREDREAFEAAEEAGELSMAREGWPPYDYKSSDTHSAWMLWQAALRYERERIDNLDAATVIPAGGYNET